MPPDTVAPDLQRMMQRLNLGRLFDMPPEPLVLAHQQQMAHQDFLRLVLGDEVSRRDRLAVRLRASHARLDAPMTLEQ